MHLHLQDVLIVYGRPKEYLTYLRRTNADFEHVTRPVLLHRLTNSPVLRNLYEGMCPPECRCDHTFLNFLYVLSKVLDGFNDAGTAALQSLLHESDPGTTIIPDTQLEDIYQSLTTRCAPLTKPVLALRRHHKVLIPAPVSQNDEDEDGEEEASARKDLDADVRWWSFVTPCFGDGGDDDDEDVFLGKH